MSNLALVAALEREIAPLIKHWHRIQREYAGRKFTFFEGDNLVAVCGGIGLEPARRAAEAVIALYHPSHLHSVGFAGALNPELHVGDIFTPSAVVDARDGSRTQLEAGEGVLVTFMAVADAAQKTRLAHAYSARAVARHDPLHQPGRPVQYGRFRYVHSPAPLDVEVHRHPGQ
jgi:adenosylhomocysteine nucleosidase